MGAELDYPANVLKELGFDPYYLTLEQEERLEEVVAASMPYEHDAFARFYGLNTPIDQIARDEGRNVKQIIRWIAKIESNIEGMKEYILTGKY